MLTIWTCGHRLGSEVFLDDRDRNIDTAVINRNIDHVERRHQLRHRDR
jgi:hypothetical protein